MAKIGIIIGSTRPNRKGEGVGKWAYETAKANGADVELIDLKDYDLPFIDEPVPPAAVKDREYSNEKVRAWSKKIASMDGFVFVTPEYNHSTSAALKNALDVLYPEWTNKACGFIGYGWTGGLRGIEHLRCIVANLDMADVRPQVDINFIHDYKDDQIAAGEHKAKGLNDMIAHIAKWSDALKVLRG